MTPNASDLRFQGHLTRLRETDNRTNFFYIFRAWAIIGLALGVAIGFDLYRAAVGWHWMWDFPFFLAAIIVIGASQHQLAGAGHEATHRTLFRDRRLNERISDWLCMFPLLTSTAVYRRQHLGHHLHVNQPDSDPDLAQLRASGHDFEFPMTPGQLAVSFLRQLWPPRLLRYLFHRARYSAAGSGENLKAGSNPLPDRLFLPWFFLLLGSLALLAHFETDHLIVSLVACALTVPILVILSLRSDSRHAVSRYLHAAVVVTSLTAWHLLTSHETITYFVLLWLFPLGSSFSFFMMLRQTIQHGNCDTGKFTNTRVFRVHPLIRYAVFPFGMDYHLPHHLYASVPHYRLGELHDLLLTRDDYETEAVVAQGCITHRNDQPTIADVLGESFRPSEKTTPVGPAA